MIKNPATKQLSPFAIVVRNFSGRTLQGKLNADAGNLNIVSEEKIGTDLIVKCQLRLDGDQASVATKIADRTPLSLKVLTPNADKKMKPGIQLDPAWSAIDFANVLHKVQTPLFDRKSEFRSTFEYAPGTSRRAGKGAIAVKRTRRFKVFRLKNGLGTESMTVISDLAKGGRKEFKYARLFANSKFVEYPGSGILQGDRLPSRFAFAEPYFEILDSPFYTKSLVDLFLNVCMDVSIVWKPATIRATANSMTLTMVGLVSVRGKEPSYEVEMIFDVENFFALQACQIRRIGEEPQLISKTEVIGWHDAKSVFAMPKRGLHQTYDSNGKVVTIRHFDLESIVPVSRAEFDAELKRLDSKKRIQ